jgi:hypothetical protein
VIALACLACLRIASPASAGSWFAGAGGGASTWRHYALRMESTWIDEADRAGLGFGGYRIVKYFALAGTAVDLGSLRAQGIAFDRYGSPMQFKERLEATGFSGFLMGIIPLHDRLGLFGTFGVFHWRQKVRYHDPERRVRLTSRGNGPCYGLGINYYLTRASNWGAHAEWTRYLDVGKEETTGHENDVDLFTIGIVHTFRPH